MVITNHKYLLGVTCEMFIVVSESYF